jgi:alpha/beta superfamily hydrolase
VPRRIESLFVAGPSGRLEALLEEPDESTPVEACVLCHPHPLYGGTMHNKVVYRMARGLRRSGSVVLRFNFRGVNLSEGKHAEGEGEIEDARAALEILRERYPDLSFALAGFSFGSRVILRLGCSLRDPAPVRLIAAGFPTRLGALDHLGGCAIPKYFVQSDHDEFGPAGALRNAFEGFAEPKQLQFIEASDHFFAGSLEKLEDAIAALPRP